jgi:5-oxoprolinase (ATP-hydrolysing)
MLQPAESIAPTWQFAIDVGGTFTDCIGVTPSGQVRTYKTLSSGRTKGVMSEIGVDLRFFDPARRHDPAGFWQGAELQMGGSTCGTIAENQDGWMTLYESISYVGRPGKPYELLTGEEAPVLGIRYLLGLKPRQPFPPAEVKLGTTRGTNALLERKGAKVALVTTRGFEDVLRIGDQARPKLFELAIRKPEPLFIETLGVWERLAADGSVLQPIDTDGLTERLKTLRDGGVDSLAIALLHSYCNPVHELAVARAAFGLGFREVVQSAAVSPTIKIVPRAESTVLDAYLNPVLRDYIARIATQLGAAGGIASAHPPGEMNLTSEQVEISRRLQSMTGQFDVETVVQTFAAEQRFQAVSRATIYSTLNLLVERGMLRIVTLPFDRDVLEWTDARASSGVSLKLMTSAGGLVDAAQFTGRDSILSGPAGGVIGSSQTAARAGCPRSIGFDMGGTSTDVSRYDGRWELEYESRKAGVRIASPMLAIETVAAGGGSICSFDGVKLVVGPKSAGSDPGPVCYGRGGPLTITDCNLALGRLVADQFPFPLNREVVLRRLEELAEEVAKGTGRRYSPEELASGLVEIANAHMARAIRRISVARGYDPADYALSVFGGAGAQHACALASQLRMERVVIHPLAGALSAYGIACADAAAHRSRMMLRLLRDMTAEELAAVFQELEAEGRSELSGDGESVRTERSLDLRYAGLESSITVAAPQDGAFAAAYEAAHQREFGYLRPDRPIEIVTARVEVRAGASSPPEIVVPKRWRPVEGDPVRVFLNGAWAECVPYRRDDDGSVQAVEGPALLSESMTTVLVEAGFRAEIVADGSILMTRLRDAASGADRDYGSADPVRLEIFNNLFASIAEQMGETLRRTSVSTNVKERLDYSCAVFDGGGELIVNAPHIPVHLGAMSETVKFVMADNPDLAPGDVVLTNDPFRGGSHLPDLTVVTPVFSDDGSKIQFVVASRAHHAEIGGIVPGSMPPFSKTLADEGVLIRNSRVVRRGEFQEAALRTLLAGTSPDRQGSRRPDDNVADITAQIAANQTGVQLLRSLIAEQSWDVVERYMRFIREAAASKVRLALAAIPDGEFTCTDHLDDGSPICVRITVAGERAVVDFAGTGPVLATNLNANRAIVTAAVLYVFRLLIDEEIPLNGGVLEPVEIRLPPCLLNPPAHDDPAQCAAIVGGNVETSQRVVDVLLGALKLAAGSQGTMNNLTFGDGTFGYYETICGGSGATSSADGSDAVHTHMTNTRLTDVELLEHRYPVRVREFAIRRGSGGAGLHHGGDGVIRDIEFLRPLTVSILSQRRGAFPPPGLDGGQPGGVGRNTLIQGERETDLGAAAQIAVAAGDRLRIETPGGGGCGAMQ